MARRDRRYPSQVEYLICENGSPAQTRHSSMLTLHGHSASMAQPALLICACTSSQEHRTSWDVLPFDGTQPPLSHSYLPLSYTHQPPPNALTITSHCRRKALLDCWTPISKHSDTQLVLTCLWGYLEQLPFSSLKGEWSPELGSLRSGNPRSPRTVNSE